MALDQSALLEVLQALKAAEVDDRIRAAATTIYQALIEAELTAVIGAGPHERTESRTAQRNGSRPRTLSTTAGDLELRIPKLRAGSFFPSLLERRRRIDQALFAVVMEAYLHGVSTRKVDDLVRALGADTGISRSEVSRICADLDAEVAAFRDRSLAEQAYPYVFLDATYGKSQLARDRPGIALELTSDRLDPETLRLQQSKVLTLVERQVPAGGLGQAQRRHAASVAKPARRDWRGHADLDRGVLRAPSLRD